MLFSCLGYSRFWIRRLLFAFLGLREFCGSLRTGIGFLALFIHQMCT